MDTVTMAWPSLRIFLFLVPISLQALLIHPIFPSAASRLVRFLLIPVSLYYTLAAPVIHGYRFEPQRLAVVLNFVLGVMSFYSSMKAIEYGCAKDLTPYTWVGFAEDALARVKEEDRKVEELSGINRKVQRAKVSRRRATELRKRAAEQDTPLEIIVSTIHLLLSMRGIGYLASPPPHALSPPLPRQPLAFLARILIEIAWSHALLTVCCITLVTPPATRLAFLASYLPPLSDLHLYYISETLTGLSLGAAAYTGLTSGFWTLVLPAFLLQTACQVLPSAIRPPAWDSRQYPPLFQAPWAPSSVAGFWSVRWHAFFSRPFVFLGFSPIEKLLGGGSLGRAAGTLGVFAMSAWLHEYGIWSAASHLRPFNPPLSFVYRWGGSIYFMAQGVAIIFEGLFTQYTGRKVGGFYGFLWALPTMGGLGSLVYMSWTTLGLVSELPEVQNWSWQRFVVPISGFLPRTIWTIE